MNGKYKIYTYREFTELLKRNNFVKIRQKGDHEIFQDESGRIITIAKNYINPMIARRLIKENGLDENL